MSLRVSWNSSFSCLSCFAIAVLLGSHPISRQRCSVFHVGWLFGEALRLPVPQNRFGVGGLDRLAASDGSEEARRALRPIGGSRPGRQQGSVGAVDRILAWTADP